MASRHDAVGRAVAKRVVASHPLHGGDISAVERVTFDDGTTAVVKRSRTGNSLVGEGEGLAWLAEARALRIPEVLAAFDDTLVLEDLGAGAPGPAFDETFGRGLAQLHRFGARGFGWHRNNLLAELHQDNDVRPTWAAFYGEARLLPRSRACRDAGRLTPADVRGIESLVTRLPELCGDEEPPARLHGDLWSGNVHTCADGSPALIDPAVYGGHREVDLAMLYLFGSPGARMMAAYEEGWPLGPDHLERRPLYQLYPLLVHVELFGRGYVGGVRRVLDRYRSL